MSTTTPQTTSANQEKTHNQRLYEEIGPQNIEDVKTAYVNDWITEQQLEEDLEQFV